MSLLSGSKFERIRTISAPVWKNEKESVSERLYVGECEFTL